MAAVRQGWRDPVIRRSRQRGFVFFAAVLVVVLLVVVALAAWYLINIPDRPLDPGITDSLQRHHDAVPPQDNLFFALLAFDSTSAENINQQGQQIYAAYLARRAADPNSRVTFDNAMPVMRQAPVRQTHEPQNNSFTYVP
jgi:hypothetical protein